MMDEAAALELADRAVQAGLAAGNKAAAGSSGQGSDETVQAEAIVLTQRSALTRFADFDIHQNVAEDGAWVSLRIVVGKRTGVATTNSLDPLRLGDLAWRAAGFAMASPADPDFLSLPGPRAFPEAEAGVEGGGAVHAGDVPGVFDAQTAEAGPAERASFVRRIFEACREAQVSPAGSWSTEDSSIAVANSLGTARSIRATEVEGSLVCTAPGGETGWAECLGRALGDCDARALVARAADKALAARDAGEMEPAPWPVVLEPAAMCELVGLLSYCGFSALAEQEGRSFMSDRIGRRITGEAITIADDGADPRTLALPFDFEGVPRRRVELIKDGIAMGVVHDSYTAGRAGTLSTGHALPAPNTHGPVAMNLAMAPGTATIEELIGQTGRGLLVTRFFYTNPLDPKRTLITGMTRDGLYRIEDGKVAGAVRNLRITESVLEAFSRVTGLTAATEAHRCILGTAVAPAARIEGFNFSSGTGF